MEVREGSQVGDARRQATALGHAVRLAEDAVARLALVTTELAQNLVKHVRGGGVLFLRALQPGEEGAGGVEVLSVDAGRGIPDVGQALQDGFSTAGTSGSGLGAVRRQSDRFDLYSGPGGTAVLARVWARASGAAGGAVLGAVCLPRPGETDCGDAWALLASPAVPGLTLLVADGLGHGPQAATAAAAVVRALAAHGPDGPTGVLGHAHAACRATRGAAALVCHVAADGREVEAAGVGNVVGALVEAGAERRGLVSQPGTLGAALPRVRTFPYRVSPRGGLLVLHSDGLTSGWALDAYRGLSARHPALVAAVLARDFSRGRDDVTVVVLSLGAPPAGGPGGGPP